jgi:hypothetical protein
VIVTQIRGKSNFLGPAVLNMAAWYNGGSGMTRR